MDGRRLFTNESSDDDDFGKGKSGSLGSDGGNSVNTQSDDDFEDIDEKVGTFNK
jgi:hypothetical protein